MSDNGGNKPCNWGDTDEVLLQKGAVENRCISIPNNLQKEGTVNFDIAIVCSLLGYLKIPCMLTS